MTIFFYWDFGVFVLLAIYAVVHAAPHVIADGPQSWRLDATLYFCKMIQGLSAFPFLVFKLPLVRDALTHTHSNPNPRTLTQTRTLTRTPTRTRTLTLTLTLTRCATPSPTPARRATTARVRASPCCPPASASGASGRPTWRPASPRLGLGLGLGLGFRLGLGLGLGLGFGRATWAQTLTHRVGQVERSKKGGKDLRSCDEKTTDAWNTLLGPSFTPKQTYAMVSKKYGPAVAKSFKPKARRLTPTLTRTLTLALARTLTLTPALTPTLTPTLTPFTLTGRDGSRGHQDRQERRGLARGQGGHGLRQGGGQGGRQDRGQGCRGCWRRQERRRQEGHALGALSKRPQSNRPRASHGLQGGG